jgi:hypothetical protein
MRITRGSIRIWRKILARDFCLRLMTLEIAMIEWNQALAAGGLILGFVYDEKGLIGDLSVKASRITRVER